MRYKIGKVNSRPFQWYITCPKIPKIAVENCKRGYKPTTRACTKMWQKKPHSILSAVFFTMFYYSGQYIS